MAIISVPKLLRDKPGEESTEALIDTLNKPHENPTFLRHLLETSNIDTSKRHSFLVIN